MVDSSTPTAPVQSVANKTGIVLLVVADVSGAAPTESPILTGVPKAPTATLGTNSNQIATTGFVTEALANSASAVISINRISGAVSITANDVVKALAFTPVQSVAGHTGNVLLVHTDITDFTSAVQHIAQNIAPVAPAAVTSINGKTGAVTITANDVVAALAFAPVQSVAGHTGNVLLVHTDITDFTSAVQHIARDTFASNKFAIDKFIYTQTMPSATWVIAHNLGFFPSVTIVDSDGTTVEGSTRYTNIDTVIVSFAFSFAGLAYLS